MNDDDPQASLRRSIRKTRHRLGLTQDQVAQALGVSRLTYHRMEKGERRIHFEMIAGLCEAFNITLNEIFDDPVIVRSYTRMSQILLFGSANT